MNNGRLNYNYLPGTGQPNPPILPNPSAQIHNYQSVMTSDRYFSSNIPYAANQYPQSQPQTQPMPPSVVTPSYSDFGGNDSDNQQHENDEDAATQQKRKRVSHACDTCNKKKVKCDGAKPSCSYCLRQNVTCSYSRGTKKRGPRAGYIESLEAKLKEMEALLKQHSNRLPSQTASKFPGVRLPPIYQVAPRNPSVAVTPETFNELVQLYFQYINPVFPVLNKTLFLKNVRNESPLLLNSIFALSARYSTEKSIYGDVNKLHQAGDQFYIKARELVDQYMDTPSTSMTTALLFLANYASGSARNSAAWMYSGMAIRMAQELRLNVEPELENGFAPTTPGNDVLVNNYNLSPIERETRRRLWWSCFVLDRYSSVAAERSMIISESECKVYLPCDDAEFMAMSDEYDSRARPMESETQISMKKIQLSILSSSEMFTPGLPNQNVISYFLLLSKTFGKIFDYCTNLKAEQKRAAEIASLNHDRNNLSHSGTNGMEPDFNLSILVSSLREWFNSLPEYIRQINDDSMWKNNPQSSVQYNIAYLHIFYHHCVIMLHRPQMMKLIQDHSEVLTSLSFQSCLASANATSLVVQKIQQHNPQWHNFPSYVEFCVFLSGLIHVSARQMGNGKKDAEMLAEHSRSCAMLHVEALKGISLYWGTAQGHYETLMGLVYPEDMSGV